jgi:hypothetical protein
VAETAVGLVKRIKSTCGEGRSKLRSNPEAELNCTENGVTPVSNPKFSNLED